MEENKFKIKTNKIYRNIILSSYVILVLALIFIIVGVILPNFNVPVSLSFIMSLLLSILGIVGGSILSVIININSELYKKFDLIKNEIASNEINTIKEFSENILEFINSSFNYVFFDIEISFIKVKHSNYVFSNDEIINELKGDFDNFKIQSKNSEGIIYVGKRKILNSNYNVYILPIWFGKEWLGYLGLFSRKRINRFFLNYLDSFEDYYIDDQLKHILNKKYLLEQKNMLYEIDELSNKISLGEYKSTDEYCFDLLKYLKNKLNCYGGIITFLNHNNVFTYFEDLPIDEQKIIEFFKSKKIPVKQDIIHYPDLTNIITFQIPIGIKKTYACIYLFSNRDDDFLYFNKIIDGVEDIKLDNDLENIMNKRPLT